MKIIKFALFIFIGLVCSCASMRSNSINLETDNQLTINLDGYWRAEIIGDNQWIEFNLFIIGNNVIIQAYADGQLSQNIYTLDKQGEQGVIYLDLIENGVDGELEYRFMDNKLFLYGYFQDAIFEFRKVR